MKRLFMASMIVAAMALPSRPARACESVVIIDPLQASVPFGTTEAPAGGVWWLVVPLDNELAAVELEHARTGVTTSIPVDTLVSRGPRHLALRVPDDAGAGDAFRLVTPPFGPVLVVTDGAASTDDVAPVIVGVDADAVSEMQIDGCHLGFLAARVEHFITAVTVDLDLPDGLSADDVLLDVWLVEPGAAPDDDDDRALEAFPAAATGVTSESGAAFNVRQPGSFDVHVRATDPRTGRSSSTERVEVINDRAPEERAPALTSWSWGCGAMPGRSSPTTLALFTLLGLALRRARRGR